jgi:hypothetical protein
MYSNALLSNEYHCHQYTIPQYHPMTPNLPPKLRESERMRFVQLWVNNIPEQCSETASAISVSTGTGSSHSSGHRLFDDDETTELQHKFRDFFNSGSMPTLGEVRQRMANSAMLTYRTPTSIRNKIKRLQSNAARQVQGSHAPQNQSQLSRM